MAGKSSNPWYFEYQDYTILKKIFDYKSTDKFDVSSANDLIKLIQNTPTKEENLRKTFCELKKLILRDECFYHHANDNCCNYINYWLNKTVRDSDYNVNKEKFYIFDKFMKDDPKIKDGATKCTSRLSYMDTDMFEKMKKLYELYDYFTELKESDDPSSLCRNISNMAAKYKGMMQECKDKDNNLCDVLKNLKYLIDTDKLVAKNICKTNIFDLFYLKIDTPRKEQKAVRAHTHRRISGRTPPSNPVSASLPQAHRRNHGITHTQPTVSVPLRQAHGTKSVETHTPPPVTVPSLRALDRNSRETTTLLPVTVSSSPAQGLETQARVESERTSSVPSEQFPLPLPLLPLGQSGPLESPETEEAEEYGRPKGLQEPEQPQVQLQEEDQVHRLKDDVDTFREDGEGTFLQEVDPSADSMQSTFNTETIMGTIKDAVSNVLEAVEPVPVLGVSGGMGALYLLFKYTPIGSLFGRNRRNNQNIPNFFDPRYGEQFSGYYPQYYNEGFTNYRMNIAYHPSSEELD